MNSKLIRTPGLYLVGFMGSGKTSVGTLVADDLGWRFVDLDEDIEKAAGTTIAGIFDTRGEAEFRRLENEALLERIRSIQRGRPTVVSLGGGAFAQPANLSLIRDNGISVWLDCPLETIRRRIAGQEHRPLARDPEKFEALYHARIPVYAEADFRIPITSDDANEAAREILSLPLF